MKSKGFTLIELLAVITIISILTVVAVPSALNFQENMKKKMFCSKIETVEAAAQTYGNDVLETIENDKISSVKCSFKSSCQNINVRLLLTKGYLKKEENAIVEDKYDEYYDPRTYRSMLDDNIIVYVDNNRVYSKYVYQSLKDLQLCNSETTGATLYYLNNGQITEVS